MSASDEPKENPNHLAPFLAHDFGCKHYPCTCSATRSLTDDEIEQTPEPILTFDVDDPEFARGVEVGVAWALLQLRDSYKGYMHATNTEMVLRLAEARSMPFRCEPASEDFVFVVISGDADLSGRQADSGASL